MWQHDQNKYAPLSSNRNFSFDTVNIDNYSQFKDLGNFFLRNLFISMVIYQFCKKAYFTIIIYLDVLLLKDSSILLKAFMIDFKSSFRKLHVRLEPCSASKIF